MHILIYVHKTSARLQYIADFIFKELLKVPYAFTSDRESFKKFEGIKINYTNENTGAEELKIPDTGLLYQTGIKEQSIEIFEVNNNKAFFKSISPDNTKYPFDIFSATFYLLSRYEEYLPYKKDKYGRYSHQNSLAYKENFLYNPLINIWINNFAEWLRNKSPDNKSHLASGETKFKLIPTYDVDIAYAYSHKGFVRSAGGGLQSVLTFKFKNFIQRLKVLTGIKTDPFDNYAWLNQLHDQYSLKPLYFFLLADKNSLHDKHILPSSMAMRQLIKKHAEKYHIGLHPSWQSGDDAGLIKKEKETLENISGIEIKSSRQHYIRFNLPEGYRQLINVGLTDDYSMGYSASNGFRASVATTHFWYDLEKEEQTKLRIHPFCYMDSTAIFIKKFTPEEAYNEMLYYYNVCKKVNGTFISILHNHLFGNSSLAWRNLYQKFYEIVCAEKILM